MAALGYRWSDPHVIKSERRVAEARTVSEVLASSSWERASAFASCIVGEMVEAARVLWKVQVRSQLAGRSSQSRATNFPNGE